MTSQFLQTELSNLIYESKRKNPELRHVGFSSLVFTVEMHELIDNLVYRLPRNP